MSEAKLTERDCPERHMTAQPKAVCVYCHKPLPEAAIGNPTWPWRFAFGRGMTSFCSKACMDWRKFNMRLNAMQHSPKVNKNRKKPITVEEFIEIQKAAGEYPEEPNPLAPHEALQEEPPKEPVNDEPAEEKPKEEQTEPEETKEEITMEDITPITVPEQNPEKRQHLKKTVRTIDIEGNTLRASVVNEDGQIVLKIGSMKVIVTGEMVNESRELLDILEQMTKDGHI